MSPRMRQAEPVRLLEGSAALPPPGPRPATSVPPTDAADPPADAPAPPERALVLWFPDWPLWALPPGALEADESGAPSSVAVVDRGLVRAASAPARARGVTGGMRLREAQTRDPSLALHEDDPERDRRAFEPVLRELEEVASGLQVLRPGLCCLRARGPARYHGGEERLVALLTAAAARSSAAPVRVGVADGLFAAQQAAQYAGPDRPLLVPTGAAGPFLAPLPVAALQRPELALLLTQLGVHTLGAFAALPAEAVRERFGPDGALAHRLAAGADPRGIRPTPPPREFVLEAAWEPALERVDEIAFSIRQRAEELVAELGREGLLATVVEITVRDEEGRRSDRSWRHPDWFTGSDVVDRVRWQVQGAAPGSGALEAPVAALRVRVESADPAARHDRGLWGGRGDDHVHRALTRVQSMLGHEAVGTVALAGGRLPAERQVLVPWGEPVPDRLRDRDRPWPGVVPGPAPATILDPPVPVRMLDARGQPAATTDRGRLEAPLHRFAPARGAEARPLRAWAGPWRLQQRWWAADARTLDRFQVVDSDGSAWLVHLGPEGWFAEARYD